MSIEIIFRIVTVIIVVDGDQKIRLALDRHQISDIPSIIGIIGDYSGIQPDPLEIALLFFQVGADYTQSTTCKARAGFEGRRWGFSIGNDDNLNLGQMSKPLKVEAVGIQNNRVENSCYNECRGGHVVQLMGTISTLQGG